jgi:hypothetical protein
MHARRVTRRFALVVLAFGRRRTTERRARSVRGVVDWSTLTALHSVMIVPVDKNESAKTGSMTTRSGLRLLLC